MTQPKLRFKREDGTEFPEWEETSFGDTCSGFEYGMNTAACSYDGTHKYIRITDIDDTSRRYLSENAVSPNGKMQDKYIVNNNDILFARTGASVGKAYLYRESDGLLYYAGFLIRANVNGDNNAYFIFLQTLTSNYNNWIKLTSMRTGQQGINAQEYKSYKFYVPCLEEQQKIADVLSNVDEVIAQSEVEVQNLEQQKKAAIQKIFSQEVRFRREDGTEFPEWEETSFGDTCSGFEYGMNTAACPYDGTHKYIRITDIDDTSRRYLSENAVSPNGKMQDKYIVNINDILFARTGASVGKAYLYKESDGLLYYAGFLIRANVNDDNNAYFIFLQTLTSNYSNWVKLASIRTGQQGINAQEYRSYKFYAPCLEEQQKIADFLSDYDDAISYAKQELDKWKELKKGLLQQLFV